MGLDHGLRRNIARPVDNVDWDTATDQVARDFFAAESKWRAEVEIIDWRKENHFHSWFVDNVQNGVDECKDSIVIKAKLMEFVDICEQLLANIELMPGDVDAGQVLTAGSTEWEQLYDVGHVLTPESEALAERLMPTKSGFFFGSTQYNEWYWKSLNEAVKVLKPVLESMAEDDTVVYWSSW